MRRVLLIAYHFPPFAGSSGVQRAFRFACHFPDFGWEPIVLTAHPRAYEQRSNELLQELPSSVPVIRAPAWDAKRHFSIAGRYPGFLGRPDRWCSWRPGAVLAGLQAIRRYRPDAIWSTFPITTAHRIGATLARLSRLPWIADFRDPMAQEGYPSDPATWRSFAKIERLTVSRAAYSTFTTPGAVNLYKQRYPEFVERFTLLENGYDEETFAHAEQSREPLNSGRLTLLHSGVVYPKERDPSCLFAALDDLRSTEPRLFSHLVVRFRAAGHEGMLRKLAETFRLERQIEILPMISPRQAAREMCSADGLLVLQASSCNAQIPAKLYEYIRTGRPILALADPSGDTADAVRAAGISAVAALHDPTAIRATLASFVSEPTAGTLPTETAVARASRRARTAELAELLGFLVENSCAETPNSVGNRGPNV